MTIQYGLNVDGFVPKTLTVIREELNAALRAAFGASLDLGNKSIFGQIVGILAEAFAKLWEQLEAVYSSQDPNKATGASLDSVSSITGTYRPPASFSAAVLTLFGTPGTVVPSGSQVQTLSTQKTFTTSDLVTIAVVPNWAATTSYSVGARVFSDTDRIYQCIVAGVSGSSAVGGTGSDITDGTAHWKLIADNVAAGTGAVDVDALATETGPITAVAGDISTIVSSILGWDTVTNLEDAAAGRALATDEELRVLRDQELADAGQTPVDAIRAAMLKIPGVLSCTVFANNSDYTNADGMPPHSVEVLLRTTWSAGSPDDQTLYDALLANVAAGIETTGNQTGSAADTEGNTYTVKFSRPTEEQIYVTLNVLVESVDFPADGADLIKTAITDWGGRQLIGKDAVASAISARAFQIDGVLDVTSCFIGLAPSPSSSSTIAISTRQLATYDSTRIVIYVTTGIP